MKVNWQTPALQDLDTIFQYIKEDNLSAAVRVTNSIMELVKNQLPFSPLSGRKGRLSKTRELVIPKVPYIVVYEIVDEQINILAIQHTAMLWPTKFQL